jgi:probable rRNA maturation factor
MILIEPEAHVPRSALPKRELSRFLADACERVGLTGKVTVLITTDARLQDLNRAFRGKNKPTDVLSFPAAPLAFAGEEAGDLAISADTARRQSESLAHPLLVEIKILILHGLLHLVGMDHEQDSGQMGRREAKLRREFGLPAGLIQRTVKAARAAGIPTSQTRDVGHPVSESQARSRTAGRSEIPGRTRKSTAGAAAR